MGFQHGMSRACWMMHGGRLKFRHFSLTAGGATHAVCHTRCCWSSVFYEPEEVESKIEQ